MSKRTAKVLIVFLLSWPLVAANIASGQPSDLAEKLAKIEKEIEEKRKELGVPGAFLVAKRAWEGTSQETIYSDYRNVDGEMVPFGFVMQGGELGRIVAKVEEVKFNVRIPASTFRPASK